MDSSTKLIAVQPALGAVLQWLAAVLPPSSPFASGSPLVDSHRLSLYLPPPPPGINSFRPTHKCLVHSGVVEGPLDGTGELAERCSNVSALDVHDKVCELAT